MMIAVVIMAVTVESWVYVVGTYVSVIFVLLTFLVTTTKPVGVVAQGEECDL